MGKGRLEAFSDGVLAIVLTIMVLELKIPHGHDVAALRPVLPVLSSYVLSFAYIAIYWNNHHHMLQSVHRVNGRILWANMHLLFWLSLVPVTTAWLGESGAERWPTAFYGVVLLGAGIAYYILQRSLIAHHGGESVLARAVGSDRKGKASLVLYAAAIPLAFALPWLACAIYVVVAILWLIPDRRIEHAMTGSSAHS